MFFPISSVIVVSILQVDEVFGLLDQLSSSPSQPDPSPTIAVLRRRLRSISVIIGVVCGCQAYQLKTKDSTASVAAAATAYVEEMDETAPGLKLWISESIVSAVVKAYLKLFSFLTGGKIECQPDVANDFFGSVEFLSACQTVISSQFCLIRRLLVRLSFSISAQLVRENHRSPVEVLARDGESPNFVDSPIGQRYGQNLAHSLDSAVEI